MGSAATDNPLLTDNPADPRPRVNRTTSPAAIVGVVYTVLATVAAPGLAASHSVNCPPDPTAIIDNVTSCATPVIMVPCAVQRTTLGSAELMGTAPLMTGKSIHLP